MGKFRILVRTDDGSWNYFIVGYCSDAAVATALVALFQEAYPDRVFTVGG